LQEKNYHEGFYHDLKQRTDEPEVSRFTTTELYSELIENKLTYAFCEPNVWEHNYETSLESYTKPRREYLYLLYINVFGGSWAILDSLLTSLALGYLFVFSFLSTIDLQKIIIFHDQTNNNLFLINQFRLNNP